MNERQCPESDRLNEPRPFAIFAMLDRMQYINRWGLMRNNRTENIKEHSMDVAMVAHALATIRQTVFADPSPAVDPLLVMGIALFHDASEIVTGDLPTPIKYKNPEIMKAYYDLEDLASELLIHLLPSEMRGEYRRLFCPDLSKSDEAEAYRLVKAADRICAYIKCISEAKSGNTEFISAQKTIMDSIVSLNLREADYFMERFIPAYGMTLDQISG